MIAFLSVFGSMDLVDIAGDSPAAKGMTVVVMEAAALAADAWMAREVSTRVAHALAHEQHAAYQMAVAHATAVSETVTTAVGLAFVELLAAAWHEAKLVETWSAEGLGVRKLLFPNIRRGFTF